ncbi:MAG: hypothetical protein CMG57_07555 [Candidatus Marinimicrobia bacterium]|nr:hypothetical protein [Candidatus Neomarinimicrobiota bacterium]
MKQSKNKIVLAVYYFCLMQTVLANGNNQYIVTGTVLDSTTNKPIEYASISLIETSTGIITTGGITNPQGRFFIDKIPGGQYSAIVEYIGYKKYKIDSIIFQIETQKDLNTIYLSIANIQMDEVAAFGERPQIIQTMEKKVFNIDESLTIIGGSATDALKKVPSVDVDIDGNISLRGDPNVTLLINGKLSGLTQGDRRVTVDNLPAAMIERIEVITNPSAKYDPDGMGGIVNLILKRGEFEGLNGNALMSAGQYDKYNISGMVNYRHSIINLYTNTSLRLDNQLGMGKRKFTYKYPNYITSIYQETIRGKKPITGAIKIGSDFFLSDQKTLSFSSIYSQYEHQTNDTILTTGYVDFEQYSEKRSNGFNLSFNGGYTQNFDHPIRRMSMEASYSHAGDGSDSYFGRNNSAAISGLGGSSWEEENIDNTVLTFDYTFPIQDKIIIESGIKNNVSRFRSVLDYVHNPYRYHYNEDLFAGYITMAHEHSKRIGFKTGLRMEQVYTDAKVEEIPHVHDHDDSTNVFTIVIDSTVAKSPFKNPYFKIYPSAYFLYSLDESSQIQIGYSKRVNRPRRESLNPFPKNTFDIYHVRNGNPYLKPEFIDIMELNYSKVSDRFSFNTGFYYKHVVSLIQWYDHDFVTVGDLKYELLTSDNASEADSYGMEFLINYRPINNLSMMLNLNSWHSNAYGAGEPDLNGKTIGYFSYGLVSYSIPGVAKIELSGRYRGPMTITTGKINSSFYCDLAIQKLFLNNQLGLTLNIKDLFDSGIFNIKTSQMIYNPTSSVTYEQIMSAERRRDRRSILISLNYNFGKLEKSQTKISPKKINHHDGNEIEMIY